MTGYVNIHQLLNRKRALLLTTVLVLVLSVLLNIKVSAAELSSRSITIDSSLSSAVTTHRFRFNTITNASIGSVVLEYCTNSPFFTAACSVPAGLVVNASVIASQTGITGLTIDVPSSTANRLVLTRTPSVIAPTPVTLRLNNITNQSSNNQTVYARISTLASIDGTGPSVDRGAVVYATNDAIGVGGYVPPFLTFCVGITVDINCSTTLGALIDFGEFSDVSTVAATSQYSGYTNDPSGFNVFLNGSTMTSGNIVISPLSTSSPSVPGTSQFGINLRANTNPSVGGNAQGSGTSAPTANYNTPNIFRFNNGELISSTNLPTNPNRFTVSYIVNVPTDQSPGRYSTTLLFTAVASF